MSLFESFETIHLILPFIGFVIGLVGTIVGGGGGIFFLPILTLFFNVQPHVAVATALAATIPICLIGSVGHHYKGHIDYRTAKLFLIGGIVGALSGAMIAKQISPNTLKSSFGIYAILIAFYIGYRTWKQNKNRDKNQIYVQISPILRIGKGSFFGLLAGIISGTFGTSGTAAIIAGLFALRLPVKLIIGTSLLVVLITSLFALAAHFMLGEIDILLLILLTLGSSFGSLVGPKTLSTINTEKIEKQIRYSFVIILILMGFILVAV